MNLPSGLYAELAATTDLTAYVNTRIYPMIAPQPAALPYIVYHKISDVRIHAMKEDVDLYHPRMQIATFSTSYLQAHQIADVVESTLKDFSGVLGSSDQPTVQRCFFDNETEFSTYDELTGKITFGVYQDYIIWHTTD